MGFLSSGGRVESPCCSIQSLQPPFIPSILFFTFHQPTVPKSNISHPSQLNIFIMISNNDENQTQDAPTLPPSEESLQPWPKCSSEWQAQVDRKKDDLFWLQPSQQKLIASLVSGTYQHQEPLSRSHCDSLEVPQISQGTCAEVKGVSEHCVNLPSSVANGMSQLHTWLCMRIAD
jgi:hypothetical protein